MPQVTLYLDEETEAKMKEAARAAGLSLSKWVTKLIQQKTAAEWPASVAELAGAWADALTAEDLRKGVADDLPRETI